MNIKHITLACAVLIAMPLMAQKKATTKAVRKQTALPVYKQAAQPTEARVADLISRMTVEEKVGQLICPLGWEMYTKTGKNSVEPSALFKQKMNEVPIGSFWAVLRADPWTQKTLETGLNPELSAKAINALQRYAVEQTRLGIPILFAEECPHGHMAIGTTVFPTSLTAASTWNPDLLYDMGSAIGLEAAAQGSNIGYGPVLDVAREPRWSRMEETFGEDPWLTSVLGTAVVRGMQGDDTADKQHVICTLKHLAAYGVPEGGHNGGPVYAGERLLRSQLLLPFEKAVKAGAGTVMTSYNSIDGIPCTSNRHLLTDMLRGEWGFNGFVYSDLLSVDGIAGMGVAANNKEAAVLALKAGLDMDLGGGAFGKNLKKAFDEGLITMADLDRAVSNVLAMKFRLGLFDNPYVQPKRAREVCRSTEHKQLAQKVAEEGTVLLKNDGILPLSRTMKRIAVIGPNADMPYNQLGDYTAPQPREEISTVLDGIRSVAGSNVEVVYERGCAIRDTTSADIPAAVRAAEGADAVVLVVGGSSARDFKTKYIATGAATVDESKTLSDMECGEGFDRATLSLLGKQEQLIEAMAKTGKPLVIVYIEGRPLLMNRAAEVANALLTAWYPGEQGGKAIASILFGDVNPSGRLPVSIPRSVGQLPVYYSQNIKRDYMDEKGTPLYPFGYGLSYTKFAYSDLTITPNAEPSIMPLVEPLTVSLSEGSGAVRVSLTVKNTGDCSGHEVVQLYLSDRAATVSQPPLQLRAFKKVCLDAGESQRIEFTLGFDELSLINQEMKRVVEPGEFEVLVGASSSDIRLKEHFVVTR